MDIDGDFQHYNNSLGFVSNTPNGSSGNDLLISAEAKLVLSQNGAWHQATQGALLSAINRYSYMQPGLYARPGWQQDQEQADDYYGLAYISPEIANEINSRFYFKTSTAAKWYEPLFWRWPALFAHAKWAAGKTPNLFLRLYWCATVAFSGSVNDQDSWKINRLLVAIAGDKGFFEKLATKNFWRRLKTNWVSMKNVYSAYYGPTHPISVYCKD